MSTQVSNPYNFNIIKNTGFANPIIQIDFPSEDTPLKCALDHVILDTVKIYKTTIPLNVNIVKINTSNVCPPLEFSEYVKVTPGAVYFLSFVHTASRAGYQTVVANNTNGKQWLYDKKGGIESSSMYTNSFDPSDCIFYSSEINKATPTVYDETTEAQTLSITPPPGYLNNFICPTRRVFKELCLQLHAGSSVPNPYAFKIVGNKTFSATVLTPGDQLGPYRYKLYIISRSINYCVLNFTNEFKRYSSISVDIESRPEDGVLYYKYILYLTNGTTETDSGNIQISRADDPSQAMYSLETY